jgi:hypothetical protein
MADDPVVLTGIAPVIVTREEYAAVQDRLASNKQRATRHNKHPELALLRCGLVRCAHCGRSLGVRNTRNGKTSPTYAGCTTPGCPHPTMTAANLDSAVWDRVASVLRRPTVIASEVARHRGSGGLDRERAAVATVLDGIGDKQARLARAIASLDDADATAPLLAELSALADQKKAATAELAALDQRIADAEADAEKVRTLTEWCQRVGANLDALSYEDKRTALAALGASVVLYGVGSEEAARDGRWVLTLRPAPSGESIVYHSTETACRRRGRGAAPPTRAG